MNMQQQSAVDSSRRGSNMNYEPWKKNKYKLINYALQVAAATATTAAARTETQIKNI